jgi:hypothetical protein
VPGVDDGASSGLVNRISQSMYMRLVFPVLECVVRMRRDSDNVLEIPYSITKHNMRARCRFHTKPQL